MELNLVGLDDAAPPLPRRPPPAGRRDRGGRGRDRDGGRGRGRGRAGSGRGANDRPPPTAPPARPAPAAAAAKGYEADLRPAAAAPPRPSTSGRPAAAEAPAHRPPAGRGGGGGGGGVPAKRPPPGDDDASLHASDSEADDVAAVLATARAKDAALEADLAAAAAEAAAAPARRRPVGGDGGSSSDSDGGGYGGGRRGGVVSFVDETKTLRPATKRARKEGGGAAAAAPARAAAPAQPRRGELVRAGVAPAVGGAAGDTFEGVGLDPSLAAHLAKSGFERPTRVQAATIPALLARRDALVRAPTGSGKTLAYAAPIMQCLAGYAGPGAPPPPRVPRSAGTRAIIILPTRELALQVGDVLATLARRYHWIVPGVLYGGESRSSEKARLRKGVAALAATPGRLLDHLENTAALAVDALEWLVLDEADRLLDLGMEAKVASILGQLRRRGAAIGGGDGAAADAPTSSTHRRVATVLLSATMSAAVAGLGGVALVDPARIGDVGGGEDSGKETQTKPGLTAPPSAATGADVAATVSHAALVVPARARLAAVAALILRHAAAGDRVLAFCSSCDGVEGAHALLTRGVSAARERGRGRLRGGDSDDDDGAPPGLLPPPALLLKLHGGMPQAERSAAFLAFSRAKAGAALIATDVAARGLDFPSLAAVVHADAPASVADYCHRAGRAGRAGAAGASVLVLTPAEAGFCGVLADAGVPPPARADARAALAPLDDLDLPPPPPLNRTPRFADEFDGVRALGAALIGATARDADLRAAAEAGFRGAVRAYATYPAALKPHFHIKKMHLGHVAHAWGLKEAPSVFGGRHEGKSKKKK